MESKDWRYEVVKQALAKIDTEDKWSKWHEALDENHTPVETNHKSAVRFSLTAALELAWDDLAPEGESYFEGWFRFALWVYSKINWGKIVANTQCKSCHDLFGITLHNADPEHVIISTLEAFNGGLRIKHEHVVGVLKQILGKE